METLTADAIGRLLNALILISGATAVGACAIAVILFFIHRHLRILNGRLGVTEVWQRSRDDEAGRTPS